MRVAMSTDGNFVSEHFGRCPSFTIIEFNDGQIIKKRLFRIQGINRAFYHSFYIKKELNVLLLVAWDHVHRDFSQNQESRQSSVQAAELMK